MAIDKNPNNIKECYRIKKTLDFSGYISFLNHKLDDNLFKLTPKDFRKKFYLNRFDLIICKAPILPKPNLT